MACVTTVKTGIAHPCNAWSQYTRCTGNYCVAECCENSRCVGGAVRSWAVSEWLKPQVAGTVRLSDAVHCRHQAKEVICIFELRAACASEVEIREHPCKAFSTGFKSVCRKPGCKGWHAHPVKA